MAAFIAQQTSMQLIRAGNSVNTAKIIVLGLTFKENCPDLRNSKVADVVYELKNFGWDVSVHDAVAESEEAVHEYGIPLVNWDDLPVADAIVAAVSHREYLDIPLNNILSKLKPNGVFMDVKSAYDSTAIQEAGYKLWRL